MSGCRDGLGIQAGAFIRLFAQDGLQAFQGKGLDAQGISTGFLQAAFTMNAGLAA